MDPVQALAILSLGAFLAVLTTAIFYVVTVRPRLLESPVAVPGAGIDEGLRAELAEQRALAEELNLSLVQHTAQLRQGATAGDGVEALQRIVRTQNETVGRLVGLINTQADKLDGLDARLTGYLSQQPVPGEDSLREMLPDVRSQLVSQSAKLAQLEQALQAGVDRRGDPERLAVAMQAQSEELVKITTRLDEWATARAVETDQQAEYTRILADLDREMAAQAEVTGRIDARTAEQGMHLEAWFASAQAADRQAGQPEWVERLDQRLAAQAEVTGRIDARTAEQGTRLEAWLASAQVGDQPSVQPEWVAQLDARMAEQATLLEQTHAEQREQSGLLRRGLDILGEMFPVIRQLATSPPRPDRDRLTDIKGIGPVYAGKLYEAGISTFRQLAAMTPIEIFTLISEPKWRQRSIDPASWIEQAGHLASQREKVENLL